MGVSWDDMEDLSQDIWIKIYDYRQRYTAKAKAKFSTFLYGVIKRLRPFFYSFLSNLNKKTPSLFLFFPEQP